MKFVPIEIAITVLNNSFVDMMFILRSVIAVRWNISCRKYWNQQLLYICALVGFSINSSGDLRVRCQIGDSLCKLDRKNQDEWGERVKAENERLQLGLELIRRRLRRLLPSSGRLSNHSRAHTHTHKPATRPASILSFHFKNWFPIVIQLSNFRVWLQLERLVAFR